MSSTFKNVALFLCLALLPFSVHSQNVGVGTQSPEQNLHVAGKLQVADDANPPTPGAIRFNQDNNDFEGYTGSKWVSLTKARSFNTPAIGDFISPIDIFGDHLTPKSAISENGDMVIIYLQQDFFGGGGPGNFYNEVMYSEKRNGVWTHPNNGNDVISLGSGDPGNFSPDVAMDKEGNAIITWAQDGPQYRQVYMSQYSGGSWTHPETTSDFIGPEGESGSAGSPAVAMDDSGDAIIVWVQFDGANNQIYKSEYRDSTWIHPVELSDNFSPDGTSARDPAVAMSNNGEAVITWRQWDGSFWRILKSEYRDSTWDHPSSVNFSLSPNGSSAEAPTVDMDGQGNTTIAWIQPDGSANSKVFIAYYDNVQWDVPSILSDNVSPDFINFADIQVAMGGEGEAVVLSRSIEMNAGIYMSERRNDVWTHPANQFDRISFSGLNAEDGDVSMNVNGDTFICWRQSGDGGAQPRIMSATYTNDVWNWPTGLSEAISPIGSVARRPSGAISDFNDIIISWEQFNDYQQIFKAEY